MFFFDINDGIERLNDMVELSLADGVAARMKALSWLSEMTVGLPDGRHDMSVLIRSGSGCPLFRLALTVDCLAPAKAAVRQFLTASNVVAIVSSASALIH